MRGNDDALRLKLGRISEIQRRLSQRIVERPVKLSEVKLVSGVDVSYKGKLARAAAVVCTFPDCEVVSVNKVSIEVPFSYIPTFFFLRETRPAFLSLRGLDFDLLFVEGHGKAHPRGYGLASHIGVLINKPTIGIAKAPLKGVPPQTYVKVGKAYVSVGHLIDLESAVGITASILENGYPRPLRIAHRLSKGEWT